MTPMHRNPTCRGILHAANAKDHEAMLNPPRACQPAMREQPVVAQVDSQASENINTGYHQADTSPAEQPGEQGRECNHVIKPHRHDVRPREASAFDPFWQQ